MLLIFTQSLYNIFFKFKLPVVENGRPEQILTLCMNEKLNVLSGWEDQTLLAGNMFMKFLDIVIVSISYLSIILKIKLVKINFNLLTINRMAPLPSSFFTLALSVLTNHDIFLLVMNRNLKDFQKDFFNFTWKGTGRYKVRF